MNMFNAEPVHMLNHISFCWLYEELQEIDV